MLLSVILAGIVSTNAINQSLCVVHRGWGLVLPENSMLALDKCWKAGFLPECDARVSKDGVIYAFHDPSYNHRPMKDYTWEEVQQIDIGAMKGEEWKGKGLRAPTWDMIFSEMAKDTRKNILMDHKDAPIKELAKLVYKHGVAKQVWWCSGHLKGCNQWKALVPEGKASAWVRFGKSWKKVDFADKARLDEIDDYVSNCIEDWAKTNFGATDMVELLVNVDVNDASKTAPSLPVVKNAIKRIKAAGKISCVVLWADGANKIESYKSIYENTHPDCLGTDYPECLQQFLK